MQYQILEDLVSKGLSQRDMGTELQISQSKVRYWLSKHKLKTSVVKISNECKNCGGNCFKNPNYCSNKCQAELTSKIAFQRWQSGETPGWYGNTRQLAPFIRKYLLSKYNNSCTRCGWNKLHPVDNLPLVEINHIDGDAENCSESNLEVLCPNCHSETHNFRARNKVSKRKR